MATWSVVDGVEADATRGMERWSDDYADYAAYTFGETRSSDADDRLDAFRRDDDDEFELPPLDNFPTQDEGLDAFAETPHAYHAELPAFDDYEEHANGSVASEQFVDAETYLANHPVGEDSFLREAAGGDGRDSWIDGGEDIITRSDSRRPSDIFVERSRNMDQVEFTSPKASDAQKQQEKPFVSIAKNDGSRMSKEVLSESGTALSSEYDIHFDNRHALTPNSLRYLQLQERERRSQSARVHIPLNLDDSTTGNEHMRHAQQIVGGHVGDSAISLPSSQGSAPSSAEKAMTAGPTVIKRALNEIDSMLHPPDFETDSEASFTLTKLRDKSRLLEPKVRGSFVNLAQESSIRATDDDEFDRTNPIISQPVASDLREEVSGKLHPNNLKETQKLRLSGLAHTQTERSNAHEPRLNVNHGLTPGETITSQGPVRSSSPGQHGNRYHDPLPSFANKFEDIHNLHEMPPPIHVSVASKSPQEHMGETSGVVDVKSQPSLSDEMPRITVAHQSTQVLGHQDDARETSTSVVPTCAKVPTQMPRRCRRLLCTVGETMTEEIVFSNGSSRTGRICVSLLPLSTGCQQFSVSPAVLELAPKTSGSFIVTLDAQRAGVVAGIFQFRAVGVDRLFAPYEALIEASIRGDLQTKHRVPKPPKPRRELKSHSSGTRVKELSSQTPAEVQIAPTFVRFAPIQGRNGKQRVRPAEFRITNSTSEDVRYQVKCSHEFMEVHPSRGSIPSGGEAIVAIAPICRPFEWNQDPNSPPRTKWCGSMTVIVGDLLSREVSLVVDESVFNLLPDFDEVARNRHALSTQSDSFYYTKKVNRRGLYFHARAVECGSCVVGESHQVPVYVCNGSDAPITVFLQALQEPFSCTYIPTTLQARKFIEVPITFRPKAPGKVATCLVAYSVHGKAAVTLVARGVPKSKVTSLLTK